MDEIINNQNNYFINKQLDKIKKYIIEHKVPIIASFVVAFLCYMFAFTNKLVNHDEIGALFGKGATLDSGRWGLSLTSVLFPDFSMPWIYGIISIVFITLAICLIIDIFKIKNGVLTALLSGLIISFPSLIGVFSYMFTSAPFSLCFLLAVWAVYLISTEKKHNILLSVVAIIFSVSIYQAYIAVTASLLVVYLLQKLLSTDEDIFKLFKKALLFVAILGISLGIYYGITMLVLNVSEITFNGYAANNLERNDGIVACILYAYRQFLNVFKGEFNYLTRPVLQMAHIVVCCLSVLIYLLTIFKKKDWKKSCFSLVLLGLLPLSICCIYLFVSVFSVHGLMMYSFVTMYVFVCICLNMLNSDKVLKKYANSLIIIVFSFSIMNNIYTANNSYLRLYLAYENSYSYYSSLMTSAINTPGFDSKSKIALCTGSSGLIEQKYDLSKHFEDDRLTGIFTDNINMYILARESFINYYLGYDVSFATEEEINTIQKSDEFKEMAIYPYYGSVKKIDNYIVVRLAE